MKQLTKKQKISLIDGCIRWVEKQQRDDEPSYICWYLEKRGYPVYGGIYDYNLMEPYFPELVAAINEHRTSCLGGFYIYEHAERLTMLRELKKKLQTKKS